MLREPAVAGSFYSASPVRLRDEISALLKGGLNAHSATGIVVPHAGYVYSGAIAAEAYRSVSLPESVLLLGPNHTGRGARGAVFSKGRWRTPLGESAVDEVLAAQLIDDCALLEADTLAHRDEHSLEVQLPFLQHLRKDVKIVPITLGQGSVSEWLTLGRQIGSSLLRQVERPLLLASSDMNHFAPADYTERIDRQAIDMMERFDPQGLYQLVREKNISMCGVVPTLVVLEAARILGADRCRLLRYDHSGRINGNLNSVVGYAALVIDNEMN